MSTYLYVFKASFGLFPFIAALITIPYVLWNYRKYGSVFSLRVLIVYSFVLYMMTAFLLVCLPLPSQEYVRNLHMARAQVIPFHFIADIIHELKFGQGIGTFVRSALVNGAVWQYVFNILMLVPFGMYLRYYFRCSLKQCILFSFLLSLFFEVSQLTGLFWRYPRNYRLFDVDDLMANTLGGIVGWILMGSVHFLPSRQQIDRNSYIEGQSVSVSRRFLAFLIDCMILPIPVLALALLPGFGNWLLNQDAFWISSLLLWLYFGLLPALLGGSTPGQKVLRLKVVNDNGTPVSSGRMLARGFWLVFFLDLGPGLLQLSAKLPFFDRLPFGQMLLFALNLAWVGLYFAAWVQMLHRRPAFWGSLSGTKLVSTIIVPANETALHSHE